MSFLLFSLRNALRKKAVALLAVLGVAFGCALMTFLFSVASGVERRVERTFSEMSGRIIISGRSAIFGGMFLGMGTPPIPASYVEEVKSLPNIKNVYAQVAVILRPQGVNFVMPLFGYGAGHASVLPGTPFKKIIEGTAPGSDDEVIIGKSLQEYMAFLNVEYRVGGVYQFVLPGDTKNPAQVQELKIVGVYQTGNEVLDGAFSGTESLARKMGKIPAGQVTAINVQVDDLDNVEAVAGEIVSRFAGRTPEVQVAVSRELLIPLRKVLGIMDNFILAISLIAVAVGSLTIMVVMLLSVIERRRDFGVLKALGWLPRDITFMVLVESVFLSLLGAALGVALGYAGLALARHYLGVDIGALGRQVVAAVVACGVAVGTVGGLYPAWRANRCSPAEILRGV